MASLSDILAGSPLVQGGLGNALVQGAQGIVQGQEMRREQDWQDLQRSQAKRQMSQQNQEQDISQANVPGATDADRLENLANIAEQAGRGDLARKYRGMSKQAKEAQSLGMISQGAKAAMMGQYPVAVEALNASGAFGKITRIERATNEAGEQDPLGLMTFYSINPATGEEQHVHVSQEMLGIAAAKPEEVPKWLEYASKASGQRWAQTEEHKRKEDADKEKARHNKEIEDIAKSRAARTASRDSNKLTNFQWRVNWAKSQVGHGKMFATEADAVSWADDTRKQSREYWDAIRLAIQMGKSELTPEDIEKTRKRLVVGTGWPSPAPAAPAPAAPAPAAPAPAAANAPKKTPTLRPTPKGNQGIQLSDKQGNKAWYIIQNGQWVKE